MDVTYDDGSKVSFTGKARIKWAKLDAGRSMLRAYLRNGTRMDFELDTIPAEVHVLAKLHGLKQKLHDECNVNVTPEEDAASLASMWARLQRGAWFTDERESSGGMLAEAIRRVMGGELMKIAAKLKEMKAKERAALEANPSIAAEMAKIREERGRNVDPIDDDELLEMFK